MSEKRMAGNAKYQLPTPHGGFFFRDDKQLRKAFAPWVSWLPCWFLWKLAQWWYFHA